MDLASEELQIKTITAKENVKIYTSTKWSHYKTIQRVATNYLYKPVQWNSKNNTIQRISINVH